MLAVIRFVESLRFLSIIRPEEDNMVPTEGFWAYRAEQEALGRANGMQPFSTKAFYAAVRAVDFSFSSLLVRLVNVSIYNDTISLLFGML